MDPTTIQLAITAGSLLWSYLNKPPKESPLRKLEYPRVDEGASVPLIYGRCRVRSPILAWASDPFSNTLDDDAQRYGVPSGTYVYGAWLFWVLGIPFDGSEGRVNAIWNNDVPCNNPTGLTGAIGKTPLNLVALSALQGNGGFEFNTRPCVINGTTLQGHVELWNGSETQVLVGNGPSFTPAGTAGGVMVAKGVSHARIPAYRGLVCVFLGTYPDNLIDSAFDDEFPEGCVLGLAPTVPSTHFEAFSWPVAPLHAGSSSGFVDSGDGFIEVNPMDALRDLLCGKRKLAIPEAYVDIAGTFATAAATLYSEGNGYSCAVDGDPFEAIRDLMQQVHGVLWPDPTDNKIKIRLIRSSDAAVCALSPNNSLLSDYEVLGNVDPITTVNVAFEDRSRAYSERIAPASNLAAATVAGRDRAVDIRAMGVKTEELAGKIAKRQLSFLSRTFIKCTATVNRDAVRVNPGDVVTLTWPDYGISSMRFRVMPTNRGTLTNGAIQLTLIQDQPSNELPEFPMVELAP